MRRLFGIGKFTVETEVDPNQPERFNWKFFWLMLILISIFSLGSKDVREINLGEWCQRSQCAPIRTKPGNILGLVASVAFVSSILSKKS